MKLTTGQVDFSLFDVHLSLHPFADPSLLRPEFSFLVDPGAFQARHVAGLPLETAHFTVRPLRRQLVHNHFWKDYHRAGLPPESAALDRWTLQVPFVCRPRGLDLRVVLDGGLGADVRATVWLWPFGWSTNLEFSLRGELPLDDLQGITAALDRERVFRLDGEELGASGVFDRLSRLMRSDLYAEEGVPDFWPVSRHFVISIPALRTPGATFTYGEGADPERPRFAASDRARMHSALQGRPFGVPDVIAAEKDRHFLLTPFRRAGFAITYFDRGTLLVLHEADPEEGRNPSAARCLRANVRTCSMVTHALLGVVREGRKKEARERANVQELAALAAAVLAALPDRYPNAFCQRLFRAHAPLAELRRPAPGG